MFIIRLWCIYDVVLLTLLMHEWGMNSNDASSMSASPCGERSDRTRYRRYKRQQTSIHVCTSSTLKHWIKIKSVLLHEGVENLCEWSLVVSGGLWGSLRVMAAGKHGRFVFPSPLLDQEWLSAGTAENTQSLLQGHAECRGVAGKISHGLHETQERGEAVWRTSGAFGRLAPVWGLSSAQSL